MIATSALNQNVQFRCMSMRERRFLRFQEKKDKESRRAYTLFSQEKRNVNNTFLKQVLTSYKTARRWKPAYQMFQNLVQQKVHPDRENFRRFLLVVGDRGGQLKNAFGMFRYSGRVIKDIASYNVMLLSLSHHQYKMNDDIEDYMPTNSLKKALELYDELKSQSVIVPNMSTFVNLLKNCSAELKRIESPSQENDEHTLVYTREEVMEKAAFIADEMLKYNVSYIHEPKVQLAFKNAKLNVASYKKKYKEALEEKKRFELGYALYKKEKEIKKLIEHEKIPKEEGDAQLVVIQQQLKQLELL